LRGQGFQKRRADLTDGSISSASAGLGVLSARSRDFAQRFARLSIAGGGGNVSKRQNADKPFVAIDHRQAPDLDFTHVANNVIDLLVIKTVLYLGRHDVANFGIWALSLRNAANCDIAIGDHANEPITVAYRQDARVDSRHGHCRLLDGFFRAYDKDASRHGFGYSHGHLRPSSSVLRAPGSGSQKGALDPPAWNTWPATTLKTNDSASKMFRSFPTQIA